MYIALIIDETGEAATKAYQGRSREQAESNVKAARAAEMVMDEPEVFSDVVEALEAIQADIEDGVLQVITAELA